MRTTKSNDYGQGHNKSTSQGGGGANTMALLLLKLSLYTEMKSQLNTHDYLYNTQQYKSSVNCYFEDTPMNVNGVSHYILKMLVDFKGVGYTGSEFAYLTGLKPKNWKD